VLEVIGQILPNTLLLSSAALLVAFVAGVLIGIVQAVRQYSLADQALSVLALFFYSMPSFWLALMLILVFALFARNVWEWPIYFPPSGTRSVDHATLGPIAAILDRARYMVLPVMSLALVLAAGIARYARGSMLEVVRQDYVRTARAKGLPERRVILLHALRNALIPVITLLGLYLPVLFSGTVFIETVFGWPGLGKTIVDAIATRDYPLVMGTSLIFGAMVVLGNLVADMLYAVVDPRIRYE
jgi:peptide/nickel transport system permease protein